MMRKVKSLIVIAQELRGHCRARPFPLSVLGLSIFCDVASVAQGQEILEAHNDFRRLHCVPDLTWSDELAASAERWASTCAADPQDPDRFAHSRTPEVGENLAWGTRVSGPKAVELWYQEKELYDFEAPAWDPTVGHFTQVIWRTTTSLGCARAVCSGQELWVCQYAPPGNVNVQANELVSADQVQESLVANVPKECPGNGATDQ